MKLIYTKYDRDVTQTHQSFVIYTSTGDAPQSIIKIT